MNHVNLEQLRNAILRFLADRVAFPFTVSEILAHVREVRPDLGADEADVRTALAILEGFNFAEQVREEPMGYTLKFKATAVGAIYRARNLP